MNIQCTAFEGSKIIASGSIADVARETSQFIAGRKSHSVLIFNDETGEPVEIDFRGSADDVLKRLQAAPEIPLRSPGRPKLGVVSREITLLPRHWEWLNAQPSGASVTLRKLVEAASKQGGEENTKRKRQEAVYKFMSAMTGDLPGYEEAIRALFSNNKLIFEKLVDAWPEDMRAYTLRIALDAFE